MQQLLIQVIVYNLQLMEQTPDGKMSDNADVVEAFFVFNSQIAKKLPQAYADTNIDSFKLISFGSYHQNVTFRLKKNYNF